MLSDWYLWTPLTQPTRFHLKCGRILTRQIDFTGSFDLMKLQRKDAVFVWIYRAIVSAELFPEMCRQLTGPLIPIRVRTFNSSWLIASLWVLSYNSHGATLGLCLPLPKTSFASLPLRLPTITVNHWWAVRARNAFRNTDLHVQAKF